jgi:hypothetical protein
MDHFTFEITKTVRVSVSSQQLVDFRKSNSIGTHAGTLSLDRTIAQILAMDQAMNLIAANSGLVTTIIRRVDPSEIDPDIKG